MSAPVRRAFAEAARMAREQAAFAARKRERHMDPGTAEELLGALAEQLDCYASDDTSPAAAALVSRLTSEPPR